MCVFLKRFEIKKTGVPIMKKSMSSDELKNAISSLLDRNWARNPKIAAWIYESAIKECEGFTPKTSNYRKEYRKALLASLEKFTSETFDWYDEYGSAMMREFYVVLKTDWRNFFVKYCAEKDLNDKIREAFSSARLWQYDDEETAVRSVLNKMNLMYLIVNVSSIKVD